MQKAFLNFRAYERIAINNQFKIIESSMFYEENKRLAHYTLTYEIPDYLREVVDLRPEISEQFQPPKSI